MATGYEGGYTGGYCYVAPVEESTDHSHVPFFIGPTNDFPTSRKPKTLLEAIAGRNFIWRI